MLNNRKVIWEDIQNAKPEVLSYLKNEFQKLIETGFLYEWVSAHLEYSEQRRTDFILGGIEYFVNH